MSDNKTLVPDQTQRSRTINGAHHIMEHSKADLLTKINFACGVLSPDDLQAIETCIKSCLQNLITKA